MALHILWLKLKVPWFIEHAEYDVSYHVTMVSVGKWEEGYYASDSYCLHLYFNGSKKLFDPVRIGDFIRF